MKTLHSVAVYHENLAYGGPEEGGWWFDEGTIEGSFPVRYFKTEEAAEKYCCRVNHWLGKFKYRYPYHSVLSEGRYVAQVYAGHPEHIYPRCRPCYE